MIVLDRTRLTVTLTCFFELIQRKDLVNLQMRSKIWSCLILMLVLLLAAHAVAEPRPVGTVASMPDETPAPEAGNLPEPTEDPFPFIIRYGNRNENKIALSMDDCYDIGCVKETIEICKEFGIVMTFYPLGIVLHEEDRDVWQSAIDAGCEIGTHTMNHGAIGGYETRVLLSAVLRPQERLDQVLGYHYPIRTLRPPYGSIEDAKGRITHAYNVLKLAGFNHIVNWDVSQTDPAKALPRVQNGSILLYHARPVDVRCIRTLIPQLQEKGFEFVTIAELIGLGKDVVTSPDLFVFDMADYY